MKPVKILGLFISFVQLASVLAFIFSIYTVTSVLQSSMSGGEMSLELNVNAASGEGALQLELSPSNLGFLDTKLYIELSMFAGGENIVSDSSSVMLIAGSQENMSLNLVVDTIDMERIFTQELKTNLVFTIDLRTLFDLVGITDTIEIKGGLQ